VSVGSANLPKGETQCNNANSTKVAAPINQNCMEEVPMSKTETTKLNSSSEKKKNILVGVINLVAALMAKGHLLNIILAPIVAH
jgi:hypothetical protein